MNIFPPTKQPPPIHGGTTPGQSIGRAAVSKFARVDCGWLAGVWMDQAFSGDVWYAGMSTVDRTGAASSGATKAASRAAAVMNHQPGT